MKNGFLEINGLEFEPYRTALEVEQAIDRVARCVERDYVDAHQPVVLLITLSGAMMFASELSKRLTVAVEWAFVKCSSYGEGMCSSGDVKVMVEPTLDIKGRDVLVLEDIVDTGNTWCAIKPYLLAMEPKSLKIATLMLKNEVYDKPLTIDYVGMKVESKFLVGYGLDYNQQGRNINGVYKKYGE